MKNKKDSKIAVHVAGGSLNELEIQPEIEVVNKKPKIILFNHEKEKTTDYKKLKQNDDNGNEARIEVVFRINADSELFWEPSEKKLVDYYLVPHHNETEYEQAKRKAEIKYLFEKVLKSKEYDISNSIKCKIRNTNGILELELSDSIGSGNTLIVRDSNIKLKFRYFIDEYELNDVYTPPSLPSPKEPDKFWTTKKIIAAALLVTIVSIIIFFREKIWRWWKGETKQEKKVREQLDIF